MKRKFFPLILISILLILTGCVRGTALLDLEPAEPSDISADELFRRMARVTDPKGIYAKAKTYRMKQNVDSTDGKEKNTYTSIILFKAPDSLKQISLKNGKPFNVVLSRGKKAWYINPVSGKSTEIPEGTPLNMVNAFNDMLNPGKNLKDIFHEILLDKKKDERSGIVHYRLICRLEDSNIAPYVFYINSKTFLISKFETVLYGADGSESLYTAHSGNYVWQNGVRRALRSLITVAGKTDISNVISFEINCPIPDSEFDVSRPWNQQLR